MSSTAVVARPLRDERPVGPSTDRRALWGILAGATLLAALLRLPNLGDQSLWYDETFTHAIATEGGLGSAFSEVADTESTPPVYYVLTWLVVQFSGSDAEWALRAAAALAGVATSPVAFFALRRFVGERAALAAAVLCAVSPVLVWYSLDARAYSLFVLTALLSVWALARVLRDPSGRSWTLWVAAGALCFFTHYYAAFLLLGELAVLVWRRPAPRLAIARWAGVLALACTPVLPLLAAQRDARTDWIARAPLGDKLERMVRQFSMGPDVPHAVLEGAGIALALAGIAAAGWALWRRRGGSPAELALIAGVALGLPLLLDLTGIDNRFFMRNLLPVWPLLAALAALGLGRLRWPGVAAYAALALVTAVLVQSDWRYQNADWGGALERIDGELAGRPVLVYPGLQAVIPEAYLEREAQLEPLVTDSLWVAVEPRRLNDRELEPVPGLPPDGLPGFAPAREVEREGFRLIRFDAARPTPLDPRASGPDQRDELPQVLAP